MNLNANPNKFTPNLFIYVINLRLTSLVYSMPKKYQFKFNIFLVIIK